MFQQECNNFLKYTFIHHRMIKKMGKCEINMTRWKKKGKNHTSVIHLKCGNYDSVKKNAKFVAKNS